MAKRGYFKQSIKLPPPRTEAETDQLFLAMRAGGIHELNEFYMDRLRFALSVLAEFNFSQNRNHVSSGDAVDFLQTRLYELCRALQRMPETHPNYGGYLAKSLRGSLRRFFHKLDLEQQRLGDMPKRLATFDPDLGDVEVVRNLDLKSEKERAYVELTMQGLNQSDIARELNCSRERVRQLKVLIRSRLEAKGITL